jgi:hypothetical protein
MEAHEPRTNADPPPVVLEGTTRIRDLATGRPTTVEAWVAAHMAAEDRDREICLEELMNAIARGDVVIDEG